MTILKYTPFLYLAVALLFIYDGIVKLSSPDGGYQLSFAIAAVCIFMFFFRRSFAKRFGNRNNGE